MIKCILYYTTNYVRLTSIVAYRCYNQAQSCPGDLLLFIVKGKIWRVHNEAACKHFVGAFANLLRCRYVTDVKHLHGLFHKK